MTSKFGIRVPNPQLQKRIANIPLPSTSYVIYFTPRSGSSRLTEILSQTKQLGTATEVFNPNFVPNISQAVQARNLNEYIENTRRWLSRQNGVFGFEITDHQLRAVFPDTQLFFDHFGTAPSFWLIREDIVAQAISLAKMVTTSIAHTVTANAAEIAESDKKFSYSPKAIKQWLKHILVAEENSEQNFLAQGIQPRRLSYEQITPMSPQETVNLFARELGFDNITMPEFDLKHHRLSTGKNQVFADRFRNDEAAFLKRVEARRAPWLSQLNSHK